MCMCKLVFFIVIRVKNQMQHLNKINIITKVLLEVMDDKHLKYYKPIVSAILFDWV